MSRRNKQQEQAERTLLELLRNELWGVPLLFDELSHEAFRAVISLAGKQAVVGLVGQSLISNSVKLDKRDIALLSRTMKELTEQSQKADQNTSGFAGFLDRKGVKYVIVKGQTLAALYPHPELRSPGDIDIYCPGEDFEKAKQLVEDKLQISLSKHNEKSKHVEFEANGVLYELHDVLLTWVDKKKQSYWNALVDTVMNERPATVSVNEVQVRTLDITCNVLYTFVHMFFHLVSSGVGLRQLCDCAVILHSAASEKSNNGIGAIGEFEPEKLRDMLETLGLFKAYKAVGSFLVEELGLPGKEFPFALDGTDKRWGKRIKKNVLARGNFGKYGRSVKNMGLWHSVESAWLLAKQGITFGMLAPREVFLRSSILGFVYLDSLKSKIHKS